MIELEIWGPNFRFFWFGLGLGYIIFCDVSLVCVQVRIVILIKELARGEVRISYIYINYVLIFL